ncbi:flagellar protein FlgN [Arthrobacter zhaoguopingii]|jgi:flagellar biosynthesis/type III secretory pathway chaperone|uniref:flagellar protein FlgN n=1 Tax=Arthrobacter zhaoguopingii TaxID=2681491 RepID=UPI001359029E|nr:flagellar protein FlgN [Arthrobacter zhaoguopingii]
MGIQELSAQLWHERELLELLMFKLEEEQLLLTAGKTRWLQHATREVEGAVALLRASGLARDVEVLNVAAEWGAGENATLRELVQHAPVGPWADILSRHLQVMTEQTERIKELRDANAQFLRAAARSTQEALAGHRAEAGTYDARGMTAGVDTSRLIDTRV